MSNHKMNDIIRKTGLNCPSDAEMADYVNAVIKGEKKEEPVTAHITECDSCFSKVASALSTLTAFDKNSIDMPSPDSIKSSKLLPKTNTKSKSRKSFIKQNRYLFIAALFFIISFIIRRYFLQFLTAALIFGFKWAVDTNSSRSLIMIYDTWKQKKREKELFKNRRI